MDSDSAHVPHTATNPFFVCVGRARKLSIDESGTVLKRSPVRIIFLSAAHFSNTMHRNNRCLTHTSYIVHVVFVTINQIFSQMVNFGISFIKSYFGRIVLKT